MATKQDIEKIIQTLSTFDISSINSDELTIFQYQGFDPTRTIIQLLKTKKDESIDDKTFQIDIVKIVFIAMNKGSVNDHNMTKMSDEGKESLQKLMSTYKVVKGGGRGKSADVITFPRVMAAFSNIAILIALKYGGKSFTTNHMLHQSLPECMKAQVFPSIIPTKVPAKIRNFLLAACLAYSIDQTITISRIKDPNIKEIAETQRNFIRVGFESPMPPEPQRIMTFSKCDLFTDFVKIRTVVENLNKEASLDYEIPTMEEFSNGIKI